MTDDIRFTLDAAFDRKLVWDGGGSVRYLVARLRARLGDDRRPAERTPLNVALVIDASGSMEGGKLEAAKRAALGLARRLNKRDRLSVISFSSDVQVHLDAVPVNKKNAARIHAEISRLQTRGMTCLSGGWFAGVDCSARVAERAPEMTPRVIVLSDGHANEGIADPEELKEHAGELRMRGVLTSALGIGDGYDEMLLKGVAENGGGRLHDAEMSGEISSVLLGELDDIFATLIEDAQIHLTFPKGVSAEALGTRNVEGRGRSKLLFVGSIQGDIEREAVFKVTCPKVRKGDELKFEISATGLGSADRSACETGGAVLRLVAATGKKNSAQPRDEELAEIVGRAWSAHVVSTSVRMNRDGAFDEAKKFIERELRHFRRYVGDIDGGHDLIRELELLAGRAKVRFSSRLRKEMVLQTMLADTGRIDHRGVAKATWGERLARGD